MSAGRPRSVHRLIPVLVLTLATAPAIAATLEETQGISPGGEPAEAHGAVARPDAVVTAVRIAGEGDPDGEGGTITSLNSPFTDGNGVPGFTGGATTGNFVWYGAGVIWNNVDALPTVLTGAEGTMGVGNTGQFVYSPSIAGDDGVWTQAGELLRDGVQAPGFPAGVNNTFNSRPQMLPSGRALWVSGFNETGGTTTQGRMLYSSTDGTPATISIVLRSDDLVGGIPIDRPSGVGFDYQLSDDGTHHIHQLTLDTGSTTNDDIVYVDGAIVAREGQPTGQGDNWTSGLDVVSINNAGEYVFSGDTSGATTSDEFIAYNGAIVLREGATVDGITLTSTASVQALSISNLGGVAHIWSVSGGAEILFHGCDAADLGGSSVAVLATGDELDLDGNGIGDGLFVDDFNASTVIGPGLWLAEDGRVLAEIDVVDAAGGDQGEMIVAVAVDPCGAPEIDVTPATLDSIQLPDVVTTQPLSIANLGTATLDWTASEAPADCAAPSEVPWLSIAPAAGSVAPAGADLPDVSFDSTGLPAGVYNAVLCIASNDADEPVVPVPVSLQVLYVPPAVQEIPAAGPLGLAALGLGLAWAAARRLRRR